MVDQRPIFIDAHCGSDFLTSKKIQSEEEVYTFSPSDEHLENSDGNELKYQLTKKPTCKLFVNACANKSLAWTFGTSMGALTLAQAWLRWVWRFASKRRKGCHWFTCHSVFWMHWYIFRWWVTNSPWVSLLNQLMQGWSTSAKQRNQIAQMTWRIEMLTCWLDKRFFGWTKLHAHRGVKVTPSKYIKLSIMSRSWFHDCIENQRNPKKSRNPDFIVSQLRRNWRVVSGRADLVNTKRNPFTEATDRRPSQRLLSRELPAPQTNPCARCLPEARSACTVGQYYNKYNYKFKYKHKCKYRGTRLPTLS